MIHSKMGLGLEYRVLKIKKKDTEIFQNMFIIPEN